MKNIIVMLILIQCPISHAKSEQIKGVPSFLTIGPGSNCDVDTTSGFTLKDVILFTGVTELRVTNDVIHVGPFTPSKGYYIRGGYNNCSDAINDIQSSNQSILDADAMGSTMTLSINGDYILENIKLINGSDIEGGGLNLTAIDMTVTLDRVVLENNTAFNGAGIYKSGINDNVNLTIVDSIIQNNTTSSGGFGGGIYYEGFGELIIYGSTLIAQNEADFGGGLYLKDTNATLVVGSNPLIDSGIRSNRAREHGGGLYTNSSVVEITGGAKTIVGVGTLGQSGINYIILGNIADSDNSQNGFGGGILVYNSSLVTLNAISIIDNHSFNGGGGIYLYQDSELNIGRPVNSNCQTTSLNGCNFFINNTTKQAGGALYAITNSLANIESTNFNGNRAASATVAETRGLSVINMTSSIMYGNGNLGANGFLDSYALGSFSSGEFNIEHVTAVKNKTVDSFILASNGPNLLNSYNNYFFNPLSGPWLDVFGGALTVVNHECQIVDNVNNSNDPMHHLITTTANANDTLNFIDEANKDFHLSDVSNLIDYTGSVCPANPNLINNGRDIDNQPRSAFADLGADENLINVPFIFSDGFEN